MSESSQNKLQLEGSVAKSLFLGNILEENIFPYPLVSKDEAETLQMVTESIDRFMEGHLENYREHDLKGAQPEEYINSLKELGLFGLIIPEEYGGLGLSNAGYSRALQQTSRYDGSTSLTIGAHSSIGMKGLLLFGNDQQKDRYLAKLASGEMVAAFCLTESGSGSDAASIKTKAEKNGDGSWTLNGEKIWITNGAFADFFTVFAKTDSESGKLSAFIVERGFEGVSTGPKEDKMGIRASATTTVSFNNVRVPAESLLGEEGKGFKIAMSILNNGRTGLGGGCVGGMKQSIAMAAKQATERKQFGRTISEFELIKEKLAWMTARCFATESVVNMVAYYIDSGVDDFSLEAAMSKIMASEGLWLTANDALQVAGGNGFMREFPYERLVRDSRINLIFEGTNEILRLYVALSGMKDAGKYLKEMSEGAREVFNDPIKGFGVLSEYGGRKVAQLTSLGRDRLEFVPEPLRSEAQVVEDYVSEFGRSVEAVLKKYKRNIIGNQHISKRIADTSIALFSSLCVLSRVAGMLEAKGEQACAKELAVARVYIQNAKRRMNQNLRRIERNEDKDVNFIADQIFENGEYFWDIY